MLLVAEGSGVSPLVGLAERAVAQGSAVTLAVGAHTASEVIPARLLPPQVEYLVVTRDGSLGQKGELIQALSPWLPWADAIYASGTDATMASLAAYIQSGGARKRAEVAVPHPWLALWARVSPARSRRGEANDESASTGPCSISLRSFGANLEASHTELPDVTVEIGINAKQPLVLENPVVAAAGTMGYGTEYAKLMDIQRLGAIVSSSVTARARRGPLGVRLAETPAGMLSSTGLQNPGLRRLTRTMGPTWASWSVPVIASIAGSTAGDFAYLAGAFQDVPGVQGIEVNLAAADFSPDDLAAAEAITHAVRSATELPIVAKLPHHMTSVRNMARAAEAGGADAVAVTSSLPGMKIDTWNGRSVLGHSPGWLSGPAIRPLAVWLVCQASQAVNIPILGGGGITCVEDALEFILAGATAVQVGTATFVEPTAAAKLVDDFPVALAARGYPSLASAVGAIHGNRGVDRFDDVPV